MALFGLLLFQSNKLWMMLILFQIYSLIHLTRGDCNLDNQVVPSTGIILKLIDKFLIILIQNKHK